MSIAASYNSWSKIYDENINPTRDLDQIITKKILSKYDFERVLELGCGTGKNTSWLLTQAQTIVGMDFSEGMLQKAKQKITNSNVQFIQQDITKEWKVDNNSFNLITSSLTLEHIQDFNHIFQQAYLKLKKDGLFFISELHPFKQYTGSKARFETPTGIEILEVFTHHTSEYVNKALAVGFELVEMEEAFDEMPNRVQLPRLISFVFRKK